MSRQVAQRQGIDHRQSMRIAQRREYPAASRDSHRPQCTYSTDIELIMAERIGEVWISAPKPAPISTPVLNDGGVCPRASAPSCGVSSSAPASIIAAWTASSAKAAWPAARRSSPAAAPASGGRRPSCWRSSARASRRRAARRAARADGRGRSGAGRRVPAARLRRARAGGRARARRPGDAAHGSLDVLVNNAGGQFVAPAEEISHKGFRAVMRLNLDAVWELIAARGGREHAPERLRQGHQRRALAAPRDPGDVPLLGRARGGGVDDAHARHGVGRPRRTPDVRRARHDRHRGLAGLRRDASRTSPRRSRSDASARPARSRR